MSEHFDPAAFDSSPAAAEIDAETARLVGTVRSMSDADVPAPSTLPGWSRGHVLAHLARNADGLVNLLTGATEGVERSAYASPEARQADIEAGSRRPVKAQLADIEAAHARFMTAVAAVPPSGWDFVLHWGATGKTPAREVLDARLREVAIHHVDLDAGHTAAQWSPEFAMRILRSVLPASEVRGISPCTLVVNDTAAIITVSGGSDVEVRGAAHELATWLLGRDSGGSLSVSHGELPTPPTWP